MFSKAYGAAVTGIEASAVRAEADVSDGLPMFEMVGYLASEVRETRERVRISLKNSGWRLPPKKITVNLSPAGIRKEGTAYDLAVAAAVLSAYGLIPDTLLKTTLFAGELSLNGQVNPVRGILPIVCEAKRQGFLSCVVPKKNAKEGAIVQGIHVFGVESLSEMTAFLKGDALAPESVDPSGLFVADRFGYREDFSEINGQALAKRAAEIAAAGMHNLLLIGPPGSGKTMLAKRLPSILPDLTFEESLELSKIYSVSGRLTDEEYLIARRPFQAPHHTVTPTAMAGGGTRPMPGLISLSHKGVLFLDELPEFARGAIEVLRQPMEEKQVTVTRLSGSCVYPADFLLLAAMNPCPCGFYPDRTRCSCTRDQVARYSGKISRPLLDRIDMSVELPQVNFRDISENESGECSAEIRKRVIRAREIQRSRYRGEGVACNSHLNPVQVKKYCALERDGKKLIEHAFSAMGLSLRAYHRILKTARTAADLAGEECISEQHLAEALMFRVMDQKYGKEGRNL